MKTENTDRNRKLLNTVIYVPINNILFQTLVESIKISIFQKKKNIIKKKNFQDNVHSLP